MLSLFSTLIAAASAAQLTAGGRILRRGQVISQSTEDSTDYAQIGASDTATTINSDVTYWLDGSGPHNWYGNINNYGNVYISQTRFLASYPSQRGQVVDWSGHDAANGHLVNTGFIQLNDIGAASSPDYEWNLNDMSNTGTLQMCGRGDTGGGTYLLYTDGNSTNSGLISFEQSFGASGNTFLWRNAQLVSQGGTAAGYLINNGAFRISNVIYNSVENVYGSGCWEIGTNAVLYMQDGTGIYQNQGFEPAWPNQKIIFRDATAVLHMESQVYSHNANFGPQLYNFTSGNAIEFQETIYSFSYISSSGILNVVMSNFNQINIKLGTGYVASSFAQSDNPQPYNTLGYNAIFYCGTAPSQNVDSSCLITAALCTNLASNPPVSSASSSSSSSFTGPYTTVSSGSVTATQIPASGGTQGTVYVPSSSPSSATFTGPFTTITSGSVSSTITPSSQGTVIVPSSSSSSSALFAGPFTNITSGSLSSTIASSSQGTVIVPSSSNSSVGGSISTTNITTTSISVSPSPTFTTNTSVSTTTTTSLSTTTTISTTTSISTTTTSFNGSTIITTGNSTSSSSSTTTTNSASSQSSSSTASGTSSASNTSSTASTASSTFPQSVLVLLKGATLKQMTHVHSTTSRVM